MQKDFLDVLRALSAESAEYLVVGGYALAAHGHVRATGDIDVWVGHDSENAKKVYAGLARIGAPLSRIQPRNFAEPDVVFQMGIVPNRVDILTSLDGVEFSNAWAHRIHGEYRGFTYPVIGLEDFKTNKKATGRPKDLQDLEILEGRRLRNVKHGNLGPSLPPLRRPRQNARRADLADHGNRRPHGGEAAGVLHGDAVGK